MPLTLTSLPYEAEVGDQAAARSQLGVLEEKHSTLALERHVYRPRRPPVLSGSFVVTRCSDALPAAGNDEKIAALFPHMHRKPLVRIGFHSGPQPVPVGRPLRVGVLFSGGPAPGGHNVLTGLYEYLATRNVSSSLLGFLGGPSGLLDEKHVEIDEMLLFKYRNQGGFHLLGSGRTKIETAEQLEVALRNCEKLELDGLVIVGGDDSNTNACLLGEYIAEHRGRTCVIGVPKTIDGDLRNEYIEASFGFDTACKTYAELVSNLGFDASSAQKVYHICRLMGRSASHITLEVALQTHPNVAIISEEVAAKRQTLPMIVNVIADTVCERAQMGKNYGLVILPEGIVEFMPDIRALIAELNEVLSAPGTSNGGAAATGNGMAAAASAAAAAADTESEATIVKEIAAMLSDKSATLLLSLPVPFAAQLCLDRDPHGNVQVSKIESERLIAELVDRELQRRKRERTYCGTFSTVTHFFGYEGRCGLPSNFDCNYCYTLGLVAGGLIEHGYTGYMARATGLCRAPELWEVGGVPLTSMMNIERRKGKDVPVIEKSTVNLGGAVFQAYKSERHAWRLSNDYRVVGPMQFYGPHADEITRTIEMTE